MPNTTSTAKADASKRRRFLQPFEGVALSPPPVWLMRQAGRYLPEYRATRAEAGAFLDLCYSPKHATEVTLQPIRRYGFDAAILFSDILVVPDALGQGVRFVEGEGPQLDAIRDAAGLSVLKPAAATRKFAIVCETVQRLRQDLPDETALIGFCGAPWTVATYMVEGHGSSDQAAARTWAYRDPVGFGQMIDILVEASIDYLSAQVDAGADALQIFDTWAGSLAPAAFDRWVIAPTKAIILGVRARHPNVPILVFPRGLDGASMARMLDGVGLAAADSRGGISLGTSMRIADGVKAVAAVGPRIVTQGNLDPLVVVAGGAAMDAAAREILDATRGRPHIFNLGHGIVPQTPPEHVAKLMEIIRGG